jgi:hypothetical protein
MRWTIDNGLSALIARGYSGNDLRFIEAQVQPSRVETGIKVLLDIGFR